MKLNINGYEVSISAKLSWKERANKQDTLSFLNELALIYADAATTSENGGYHNTARRYQNVAHELHEFNKEHGLYK